MRTIINTLLSFSFILFVFSSCTKEAVSLTVPSAINDKAAQSSLVSLAGDTSTLTLQPGPDDGQDCYVSFLLGNPSYASFNSNFDPELAISAWTVNGAQLRQRSYLKFPGISTLPDSSRIISAQLYLYGIDPNTSETAPQGNSLYPGSPYSRYTNNGCFISLVSGGDWLEDTITWNTKPAFYSSDYDGVISSSTSQWNYDVKANVTPLVKAIVRKKTNYGFCIHLQDETIYRCMLFASSEGSDPAKRPKLVIKYAL